MCVLDEATGAAFLDDDPVCAVVYSLIGRRDRTIDPKNADIPDEVMYIGMTGGRDSIHEFFGLCVRIDGEWLSAGYENTGPLLYLIGAGTHSWDARVVVRVPFDMVSNIKTCMASMHWLEDCVRHSSTLTSTTRSLKPGISCAYRGCSRMQATLQSGCHHKLGMRIHV